MKYDPISNDMIAKIAPSTAATRPMAGASEKYDFIPTLEAVDLIRGAGWQPYQASQAATRLDSKKGFQRHVVKFSMGQELMGDNSERIDLVLMNSHDRGTAFKIFMGIFRIACSNGLIVGDLAMSFTHKHVNFDQSEFIKSVRYIEDNSQKIAEKVHDYKQIKMDRNESGIYTKAAAQLISDNPEEISQSSLSRPRRFGDRKDDLWTLFNRTQENIIKGGVMRTGLTENGRRKRRTKGVSSIGRDIKLNKALWTLTDEMAKLKKAA